MTKTQLKKLAAATRQLDRARANLVAALGEVPDGLDDIGEPIEADLGGCEHPCLGLDIAIYHANRILDDAES